MGIGMSIFLIALGAVLRYAVHTSVEGFSIHTVGVILMIAGVAGLILTFLLMTMARDRDRGAREGGVVTERDPVDSREGTVARDRDRERL